MTRKDYMDGKVTHAEYYSSIAKTAGISFADSDMLPRIKKALASGDEHLNSIPLRTWDLMAYGCQASVARALKVHDDNGGWSLCEGVCTLKQAAREAAEAQS